MILQGFTHLSRTGVVIHSVRNKVIHKNYVFFVTSRSRTFRFIRNKELVLTNKQKQFCKKILFLRDTREKCFLRYREPATLGYVMVFSCVQWVEMRVLVVCFVDIGRIVDHHYLNFLFIIIKWSFPYSRKFFTTLVPL